MYANIETERLTIRKIQLSDAEFMIDLVNSEGWLEFIGDRNIKDRNDAEKYIQKILDTPNFYYSVFELKDLRKAIGIVTFLKREDEEYPDIGFALLPEFEKNGYTLEACKAYLEKVNLQNEYDTIIGITIPTNQKSISLLQKLGLKYLGDVKNEEETVSYFSVRCRQSSR